MRFKAPGNRTPLQNPIFTIFYSLKLIFGTILAQYLIKFVLMLGEIILLGFIPLYIFRKLRKFYSKSISVNK